MTRYERIYKRLKSEAEDIKNIYQYNNLSMAFSHLMLKIILDINDDEANASITDGFDDNGIDAVYIDTRGKENEIHFFQFKFPESEQKIEKGITQSELLKIANGFELFISNDEKFNTVSWNDLLIEKRNELIDLNGETEKNIIHIVRFSTCENNQNNYLENQIAKMISYTGNDIVSDYKFAKEISELFEKSSQNNWPDFSIKFKKDLSPFEDSTTKVLSYYVSLYSIYDAVKELKNEIFDGNVRYFDRSSKVNAGIKSTLTGNDCEKFHLLNNGITIVCSSAKTNTPTDEIIIKKGSIVNGAQTVGCIIEIIEQYFNEKKDIEKFKNSFLFVRVIEVDNKKDLIDELVFTLNTQNQMKNSYSISNDPQVKLVQKEINEGTKYFLQIKNNEYNHIKYNNRNFDKLVKDIIDIETGIQTFVAYWNIGEFAYLTKNNKASLFGEENRTIIIEKLDSKQLIESYELYLKIMEITRSYRAYRKDSNKTDILKLLNTNSENIDNYRFINTGNFIILYALGLFCRKNNITVPSEHIVEVINAIMPLFKDSKNPSNLTKTKECFDNVKNRIENNENSFFEK